MSTVLVILRMALGDTRAQPVRFLVLLGTIGAIHEFARAFRLFRLVPAERIVVVMLGLANQPHRPAFFTSVHLPQSWFTLQLIGPWSLLTMSRKVPKLLAPRWLRTPWKMSRIS